MIPVPTELPKVLFCFFKAGFHFVLQAGLKFIMQPRLASNLPQTSCSSLLGAEIQASTAVPAPRSVFLAPTFSPPLPYVLITFYELVNISQIYFFLLPWVKSSSFLSCTTAIASQRLPSPVLSICSWF